MQIIVSDGWHAAHGPRHHEARRHLFRQAEIPHGAGELVGCLALRSRDRPFLAGDVIRGERDGGRGVEIDERHVRIRRALTGRLAPGHDIRGRRLHRAVDDDLVSAAVDQRSRRHDIAVVGSDIEPVTKRALIDRYVGARVVEMIAARSRAHTEGIVAVTERGPTFWPLPCNPRRLVRFAVYVDDKEAGGADTNVIVSPVPPSLDPLGLGGGEIRPAFPSRLVAIGQERKDAEPARGKR